MYVDADSEFNLDAKEYADCDTASSRPRHYIMYAGCPILWKSQLQTKIVLSSTASNYTSLS